MTRSNQSVMGDTTRAARWAHAWAWLILVVMLGMAGVLAAQPTTSSTDERESDDLLLQETSEEASDNEDGNGDDLLLQDDAQTDEAEQDGDDLLLQDEPDADESEDSDTGGDDLLLQGDTDSQDSGDSLLQGADDEQEQQPHDHDADADAPSEPDEELDAVEMHKEVFEENRYPPATSCASCHPKHYREWSASQHAYAQMSPVFNAMQGRILQLTKGTNGDFCIRCHTPVGMNLDEPVFMSNIDRHPTSREGVTCIVCHRVNKPYGKISGRLAIVTGDLTAPVYGPTGNDEEIDRFVNEGAATAEQDGVGRKIHSESKRFFQLVTPAFCGTCHDVTLRNNFRLEEAFSEFKAAPAAKQGISCQDCHMNKEQGIVLGDDRENYEWGPAAQVGSKTSEPRKLTNHMIVGPDYPAIHPALFPLNHEAIKEEHEKDDPSAQGLATIREWLKFDWKAGWGTDEFEDEVWESPDEYEFPDRWATVDDRYDARAIIEENLELRQQAAEMRLNLLRHGYKLSDVMVDRVDDQRIAFKLKVANGTTGHGVPTGFDAERLVWLHVTVTDRRGNVVMESGDLDPNGDVRDLHSKYVHNHELPLDDQLFTLQSRFVVRMLRGGEREQVLAVNRSVDPLPFVRPMTRSGILLGRPAGARKHRRNIQPGDHRWARYEVRGEDLAANGPYHVRAELKAGMVPVNLIDAIKDVGFDYDMSARDIAEWVVAGHQILWRRQAEIAIDTTDAGQDQ
ncbi:MAG: multiheme c-type cytochrome [Phycisphaeraceae bacterium]